MQDQPALPRPSRTKRTAILGVVYQGVYGLSQLTCLGVLSRHVAPDVYGLWMAVLAMTTWIPLAALGQNAVVLTTVGAAGHSDSGALANAHSASLSLVLISSLLLLAILSLVGPWLPWGDLLNANTAAAATSVGPVAIFALGVTLLALVPSQVGYAVIARQRGDVVHISMSLGSVLSVALTTLAAGTDAPLWLMGALSLAGPLLGGGIAWVYSARRTYLPAWLRLSWHHPAVDRAKRAGAHFVAIDGLLFALARSPELLVAHLHGIEAVGPFASVGRLSALMFAAFQALLIPMWPGLAKARACGDHARVRRAARNGLLVVLTLWTVGAALLPTVGPTFIRVWLGRLDPAVPALLWAATLQALAMALLAWLVVVLAALSRERTLMVALGATALMYFVLGFALGQSLGPIGIALAQGLSVLLVAVPIAVSCLWRILLEAPAVATAHVSR